MQKPRAGAQPQVQVCADTKSGFAWTGVGGGGTIFVDADKGEKAPVCGATDAAGAQLAVTFGKGTAMALSVCVIDDCKWGWRHVPRASSVVGRFVTARAPTYYGRC